MNSDLGQLLSGPLAGLGFGGACGAVVGYTAKKITKAAAILLGLLFIVVQILVYNEFITVNWGAVENTAKRVWVDPAGRTLAERGWDIIRYNLPFGGGFVAGFAIGFKLG